MHPAEQFTSQTLFTQGTFDGPIADQQRNTELLADIAGRIQRSQQGAGVHGGHERGESEPLEQDYIQAETRGGTLPDVH